MTAIHWLMLGIGVLVGLIICLILFRHPKSDGVLTIDFDQQPPVQLKFGIGLDELATKEHIIFEVHFINNQIEYGMDEKEEK